MSSARSTQLERACWYLRDHAKMKSEFQPVKPLFAGVDGYEAEYYDLAMKAGSCSNFRCSEISREDINCTKVV